MLSVFVPSENSLKKVPSTDFAALPESAVWIDLVKPTAEEDRAVERLAGIAVPTREDMQEIEISSRLYIENGARYMTATLMCQSDTDMPRTTAVTNGNSHSSMTFSLPMKNSPAVQLPMLTLRNRHKITTVRTNDARC